MSKIRVISLGLLLVLILAIAPMAVLAQDPLTEKYTAPGGSLSLSYPAGWYVEGDPAVITLINDEEAMEAETVPPGAIGLVIVDPSVLGMIVPATPDSDMTDIITAIAMSFGDFQLDEEDLTPVSFTSGGRDAMRLDLSPEEGDVLVLAVDYGDRNVVAAVAVSARGGMSQFEDTVLAIVASIEYAPAWRAMLQGHTDWVNGVAFSPDGATLASASDDYMVRVWDVESGTQLLALEHPNYVQSVAFSPDGAILISACDDGLVRVWDAATGDEQMTIEAHTGSARAVAFSPDGAQIASGSSDYLAKVWDAASGDPLLTLEGHTDYVNGVAFSPDGTLIATVSDDGTARLWQAATGATVLSMEHPDYVNAVAFSPDGATLVTGSDNGIVYLWDATSGESIAELEEHTDYVNSVAFSPDGALIASGSDDNSVRVWDVASGTEVTALLGHADWVNAVAFSPDGTLIASGSDDSTVRLWDVPR